MGLRSPVDVFVKGLKWSKKKYGAKGVVAYLGLVGLVYYLWRVRGKGEEDAESSPA